MLLAWPPLQIPRHRGGFPCTEFEFVARHIYPAAMKYDPFGPQPEALLES
jgi:hypothetical protein